MGWTTPEAVVGGLFDLLLSPNIKASSLTHSFHPFNVVLNVLMLFPVAVVVARVQNKTRQGHIASTLPHTHLIHQPIARPNFFEMQDLNKTMMIILPES